MKLEKIAVADLVIDPSNARKHDGKNLGAIAGSLTQFGQRKPIVISQDNTVVAGNGTLEAARSLGWQTIEAVRIPEDWTTNQIKAFALADNRTAELASWLPEVLAQQLFELEIAGFEIDILAFDQQSTADFEPIESNERLDTKSSKFCPECGHDITNY